MMHWIERLVALDLLLNNAKEKKWDPVKQFLRQQPNLVNEKPPYRKWYLPHYLASIGELNIFQELAGICQFKFNLVVDEKTISQIARENNFPEFADYADQLAADAPAIADDPHQSSFENNDVDGEAGATNGTGHPNYFGPHFHDDPGIVILSINSNALTKYVTYT